jgi:hypothetical protein
MGTGAIISLVLKMAMGLLQFSRQSRIAKLQAEKAAEVQEKEIIKLQAAEDRLRHKRAVAMKAKELEIFKETTRVGVKRKQLDAEHEVEAWSDEEVDQYLKSEGIN